jgi:chromosome segregation ATPase
LSEIEAEKMVKTTDAKVAQALKELKIRCRGFMGQMFELVKPINQTYDIAVKVSLIKCLKMLVVDTPESAAICSDFLKEKQISMEVLVLSNVPDRKLQ